MRKTIFLIVAALFFAACGTPTTEVKNTANTAAVNTATNAAPISEPVKEEVFTAGTNPRADVISAAQKLQKLDSWSAKVTSETTPELNAEMEYLAPDRYRMKDVNGEVIVIGSDSYVLEDGKWTKSEEDISGAVSSQIKLGLEAGIKNLKDVQILGKEKFNGKESTIYSHKIGDETIKIWLANDNGLQLKNEVEAVIGGEQIKLTRVYDYGKKVKIEAPEIK